MFGSNGIWPFSGAAVHNRASISQSVYRGLKSSYRFYVPGRVGMRPEVKLPVCPEVTPGTRALADVAKATPAAIADEKSMDARKRGWDVTSRVGVG